MKRALVLCGGGSLGSYETGVWKYCREAGMDFDIITGTSIGAINGALVAADAFDAAVSLWNEAAANKVMNHGLNFPRDFLNEFDWKKDGKTLQKFAHSYLKHGGADISPFMNWVKEAIPVHEVKASKKTLGIVTTSFPILKEQDIVLNDVPEENILDYLHASSACFPVFPVYSFGGKSYIDGGYFNNLPIDFAFRLGADEVVAVLLHSVPKVPQHPELMKLPAVETVYPSRDTGSIMDFEHNVIMNNLTLGYLDACKHFGKYWGYGFAFKPDLSLMPMVKEFDSRLAKHHTYSYFNIQKALSFGDMKAVTPLDNFIRTLEMIGDDLGLDYLTVYEVVPFIKLCQKQLRKKETALEGAKFGKESRNWGRVLNKKDRVPLLAYLDKKAQGKKMPDSFNKLASRYPVIYAFMELVATLKDHNLL